MLVESLIQSALAEKEVGVDSHGEFNTMPPTFSEDGKVLQSACLETSIDSASKQVVAEMLRSGSLAAAMEATQIACNIYNKEGRSIQIEADDRDCAAELIKIVCKSDKAQSWASQHAVWALAAMSRRLDYAEIIVSLCEVQAQNTTAHRFLDTILHMCNEDIFCSYTGGGLREKCVEIMANLLFHASPKILNSASPLAPKAALEKWLSGSFIAETCRGIGIDIRDLQTIYSLLAV